MTSHLLFVRGFLVRGFLGIGRLHGPVGHGLWLHLLIDNVAIGSVVCNQDIGQETSWYIFGHNSAVYTSYVYFILRAQEYEYYGGTLYFVLHLCCIAHKTRKKKL